MVSIGEAIDDFDRLRTSVQRRRHAHVTRGCTGERGDIDEAKEQYEDCTEARPDDETIRSFTNSYHPPKSQRTLKHP